MSEQKQSSEGRTSGEASVGVPNPARRRLIGRSLAVVPVVMTLTSRPLWAQVVKNASNATGCRYINCMNAK